MQIRPNRIERSAFSIVELLTVAAGMGLLAVFALPLVRQADAQRDTTVCLGNLRQLGLASLAYAAEDPRGQIIGMHRADVLHAFWADKPQGTWTWRFVLPYVYGGRSANRPLEFEPGVFTDFIMDEAQLGASTRPLSIYLAEGGEPPVELFHCPADAGYPDVFASGGLPDVPAPAVNIPCFDLLGNSYRRNGVGLVWLGGGGNKIMELSSGPFGHTAAEVGEPEKTVLHAEPIFYTTVRRLAGDPEFQPVPGWHGQVGADNVAYCDGSARTTEIGALYQYSADELALMALNDATSYWFSFLNLGASWRLDCWPAPGAYTVMFQSSGEPVPPPRVGPYGWPYEHAVRNGPPG